MTRAIAIRPWAAAQQGLAARLALLLALSALLAGSARAQAGVGDPAPDFTKLGNDGITYTLSDAFGQQVQLIYFIGYS
jgi:hypothetical protein